MTDTATARTVDGTQLPVAGHWAIDTSHSSVEVSVRHLGLSKVRGSFPSFTGGIDVAAHPTIDFRSTKVTGSSERWKVEGDLTIRGTTRPVTLDVRFEGLENDPWGGSRAAFSASTELDREAFGLTWNQNLETGGVLVGKKAALEIEAELVRQ